MYRLLIVVVLVQWIAMATMARAAVRPGRGPLLGYLHEGKCIASADNDPASFSCVIMTGELVSPKNTVTYYYNSFKDLNFPYRWRVSHGHFWATSYQIERTKSLARMPLADFDLLASKDPDVRRAKFAERYPTDPSLSHQDLSVKPVVELARNIRSKTDPLDDDRLITEAYWDFLPTAPTKMTLFILHEKKIQLLEGSFTRLKAAEPDGSWWDYKWDKKPTEVIAAHFHSPFIAYQSGKNYFFLTQFCECHGLKDDGKGGRETVLLWGKEDQPIARLITDTATGKTFAFTLPLERKDGTKAKPGYFELSGKPELVEYDPAKIKKNSFEYPYKQIRECVDILLADKKIDPEKHKPKDRK